jgi:hypothetical protein
MLAIVSVGVVLMSVIIYNIIQTIRNTMDISGQQPEYESGSSSSARRYYKQLKKLSVLRTPLLFLVVMLVLWVSLFAFRFIHYVHSDDYDKSTEEYIGDNDDDISAKFELTIPCL